MQRVTSEKGHQPLASVDHHKLQALDADNRYAIYKSAFSGQADFAQYREEIAIELTAHSLLLWFSGLNIATMDHSLSLAGL